MIYLATLFMLLLLIIETLYILFTKKTNDKLSIEKNCYEALFELTGDVLWQYSVKEDLMTKSDPDLGIRTGLAKTPDFGNFMRTNEIVFEDDLPIFEEFYKDLRNGTEKLNYQFRAKTISGSYQWFELNATTIFDKNREPVVVLGQTSNIHKYKQVLDAFHESIDHDELTKVYTKEGLELKIDSILNTESKNCALFLIDIDQYETINSRYGYIFGDALLLELATKLKWIYQGKTSLVGRAGGDEFAIFISNIENESSVEIEAKRILATISETLVKDDNLNYITACMGISLSPDAGTKYRDLLKNCDTALYYAKQQGKSQYAFYHPSMQPKKYIAHNGHTAQTIINTQKYDYSLIDSQIIANIVEILSGARNLESSINMILGVLGTFYKLNYIGVLETNEETKEGHINYEWRVDSSTKWNSNITFNPNIMERLARYNNENLNYFSTSNIEDLATVIPSIHSLAKEFGITGVLECGMYEHNLNGSYVAFCFNTPDRKWEQHEIDTLQLISKILSGYIASLETERKAAWMQRTDPLTECNNLTTFNEEALNLILKNPETDYVLFYSDLDKFKLINENYGYTEGDHILIEFANQMRIITEEDETFARLNGDRFVGLFKFNQPKHFLSKIKVLNDYMNSIPTPDNSTHHISIIIGLAHINPNVPIAMNIDCANMARKSIQNRHKSRYVFFTEAMKKKLLNRHEIESQMELALQNNDFKVYYQPKFDLKTNKISGSEALVRWAHAEKGLIAPDDFIPIFEENQFILKLDFYVFEHVCIHIRKMMDLGKTIYPVSINFSRLHLCSNDMLDKLQSLITKYQVPPSYLEIELTESALQMDDNTMLTLLIKLHKMGFKISMDDFGSGLSSLNLLRTLPCDILKLDKEFFQQGSSTKRERIVITMIVKMARELHMTIVSEGVETEEQAEFLRSIHCDLAQGYLFSKPIPADEYEELYYNIYE